MLSSIYNLMQIQGGYLHKPEAPSFLHNILSERIEKTLQGIAEEVRRFPDIQPKNLVLLLNTLCGAIDGTCQIRISIAPPYLTFYFYSDAYLEATANLLFQFFSDNGVEISKDQINAHDRRLDLSTPQTLAILSLDPADNHLIESCLLSLAAALQEHFFKENKTVEKVRAVEKIRFEELPQECFAALVKHLSLKSMGRLLSTCKKLSRSLNEEQIWKIVADSLHISLNDKSPFQLKKQIRYKKDIASLEENKLVLKRRVTQNCIKDIFNDCIPRGYCMKYPLHNNSLYLLFKDEEGKVSERRTPTDYELSKRPSLSDLNSKMEELEKGFKEFPVEILNTTEKDFQWRY